MNIESLITDGCTTDRVACEMTADILFKSDLVWHCEVRLCGHNNHCLLYTSPSPRDTG